jgi:hypothetical protein
MSVTLVPKQGVCESALAIKPMISLHFIEDWPKIAHLPQSFPLHAGIKT